MCSLSAQTNFAVGAVLNATFGSVVEITLYILALFKGRSLGTECYDELVKASLVGKFWEQSVMMNWLRHPSWLSFGYRVLQWTR